MDPSQNGHSPRPAAKVEPAAETIRVEVRRVTLNETIFVRTLSEKIGGLFTHYYGKNSHVCRGRDCPQHVHKVKQTWKGYIAAQEWLPGRKKWRPCVLEITEALELDMRFLYDRGQEWELSCPAVADKRNPPVKGIMHKRDLVASVPAAFDITPVLLNLYHVFAIDLSTPNPMPPRVFLEELDGEEPEALQKPVFVPDRRSIDEVKADYERRNAADKAARDAKRRK